MFGQAKILVRRNKNGPCGVEYCVFTLCYLVAFIFEKGSSREPHHNAQPGITVWLVFLLGYTDGNVSPFIFSDYCRYTHIYPNGCGDPFTSLYNELQAYFIQLTINLPNTSKEGWKTKLKLECQKVHYIK